MFFFSLKIPNKSEITSDLSVGHTYQFFNCKQANIKKKNISAMYFSFYISTTPKCSTIPRFFLYLNNSKIFNNTKNLLYRYHVES